MYELLSESTKDLGRLRISIKDFGNYKKIPEMLGFDGKYSVDRPKANSGHFWQNIAKKSTANYSIPFRLALPICPQDCTYLYI